MVIATLKGQVQNQQDDALLEWNSYRGGDGWYNDGDEDPSQHTNTASKDKQDEEADTGTTWQEDSTGWHEHKETYQDNNSEQHHNEALKAKTTCEETYKDDHAVSKEHQAEAGDAKTVWEEEDWSGWQEDEETYKDDHAVSKEHQAGAGEAKTAWEEEDWSGWHEDEKTYKDDHAVSEEQQAEAGEAKTAWEEEDWSGWYEDEETYQDKDTVSREHQDETGERNNLAGGGFVRMV